MHIGAQVHSTILANSQDANILNLLATFSNRTSVAMKTFGTLSVFSKEILGTTQRKILLVVSLSIKIKSAPTQTMCYFYIINLEQNMVQIILF